jgi:UDP-N-acetylglucosamine 2-epimerase (non-hydrolysing)
MKIISVVGARPNFMKIAPFVKAIERFNCAFSPFRFAEFRRVAPQSPAPPLTPSIPSGYINHILLHTGQHYDLSMSDNFFKQLEIPDAEINLGVGSGTHAEQVGNTMIAFERVLKNENPDWVVVVGDVNATLACTVTAKKEGVKVCHIEAGLRSGDMTMPEEINRLVTDRLSDLLLAPDWISVQNLKSEGVPDSKIRLVGNIMIDTLEANRGKAEGLDIEQIISNNLFQMDTGYRLSVIGYRYKKPGALNIEPGTKSYAVLTLHRPSNVDSREVLESIVNFLLKEAAVKMPLIWPLHPRTRKQLADFDLLEKILEHNNIILLEPIGYLEMLRLNMTATVMLTDSGGLQEECTILGTPCITLRNNTERPVTLIENGGVSVLVGNNIDKLREEYAAALLRPRLPVRPELWDGHAAERCLRAIMEWEG